MSCIGRLMSALMRTSAGFESKMPLKPLPGYAESACCCWKTIKHANLASEAKEQKPDMTEAICWHYLDLKLEKTKMLKEKFHAIALQFRVAADFLHHTKQAKWLVIGLCFDVCFHIFRPDLSRSRILSPARVVTRNRCNPTQWGATLAMLFRNNLQFVVNYSSLWHNELRKNAEISKF